MTVGPRIAAALGIAGLVMFALLCVLIGYVIHDDGPPAVAPAAPQTIALTTTTAPAASSSGATTTDPVTDAESARIDRYEGWHIASALLRMDACEGAPKCLTAVGDLAVNVFRSTSGHIVNLTELNKTLSRTLGRQLLMPTWLMGRHYDVGGQRYTFSQVAPDAMMVTQP
jgi:hypothetical protein